ncbi:MAG: alpha/beta fold hydrolase [Pseudomonadota bacterium]
MLAYTQFGPNDAPPLMLVHGLFGSGRNWGAIAKGLSDAFHVTTVDLRNHGDSPRTRTHTYHDMADDLAQLIDDLGAPTHLMGHSMGGKAAMVFALNRPDLIDRLIIADIAPVTYSHSQLPYIKAMRAVNLNQISRRSEAEDQLQAQGVDPALGRFFTQSLDVAERRWKLNLETLGVEMPRIMGFPDVSGQHSGPTLFLTGANSDYVTPQHRPAIRALFPQARFVKLKDAGHWLHAERPRAFIAALQGFLGN